MATTTETLVIYSGANSEIARPFLDFFSNQTWTKILALFKTSPIISTENIIPVKIDLLDINKTKNALLQSLQCNDFSMLKKIYFLHFVWGFKYEGKNQIPEIDNDNDGIDDEIFSSNITTFNNIFDILYTYRNNSNKEIPITLFNIGSKRDHNPKAVPWPSYAIVKNKLRKKFSYLSNSWNNINGLFINAATIDISKERKLRPFGEYEYWLSVNEIFEKSILELQSADWYKELEIYKYHPKYETHFKQETLDNTHDRWLKEMWRTNDR
jgi:hypothetical protein